MKFLLDENLPRRLVKHFKFNSAGTVYDMGWSGIKNGELLKRMIEAKFNALITFDKNIGFQQNFEKYPIPVIVIIAENNRYETIFPIIEKLDKSTLNNISVGINYLSL